MTISLARCVILALLALPLVISPPTRAQDTADAPANPVHRKIADAIGTPGVVHEGVYTITLPRRDLEVLIDGDQVPVAAGLSSVFYFYRGCCGLTYVAGRFCVLDYEVNDVLDSLRKANIRVGSVANLFVHDKPRVMAIHFQGDADLDAMLHALKDATSAIGPARNAPQKLE